MRFEINNAPQASCAHDGLRGKKVAVPPAILEHGDDPLFDLRDLYYRASFRK